MTRFRYQCPTTFDENAIHCWENEGGSQNVSRVSLSQEQGQQHSVRQTTVNYRSSEHNRPRSGTRIREGIPGGRRCLVSH